MLANVGTTKSGSTDFDSRGMYAMKPALSGAFSDLDPCIAAEEPPKTQYKRCNASCIEPFLLHACLRMHATRQHTKVPCSNGRGAATAYFDAASASSYRSCGRNAHMPVMLACVPGCAVRQRRNLSRPSVLPPRQLIPNPGASGGRVNWPNQRCNPMLMHKDCACGLGSDAAGSLQRKKKKKNNVYCQCRRCACEYDVIGRRARPAPPAVSSIWCPCPGRICAIDCMHALHQRM